MPRPDFLPSPAHLRAFCMVADHGSFTAAAAAAGQSQSALSQALSALEAGLGTALLRRASRRLELTADGARLLPLARAALSAAEAVVAAAAYPAAEVPLRLGIIPTAAPYLLGPLLRELAGHTPTIAPLIVEDRTADLVDAVRAGHIDAAVVALPVGESGLEEIPLYTERFVLAVPPEHPLGAGGPVSPADLDEQTMLLLDHGHCLREQTIDLCRTHNARVLGATQSRLTSLTSAVQCAAAGMGITIVPATSVATELAPTNAVAVEFTDPAPARTMGVLTRATAPAELIAVLRQAITGPVVSALPITVLPAAAP